MLALAPQLAPPRSLPPRPFLKWAGGKGQLIAQYQTFFPKQIDTYYEPFLGGGAIFFRLLPAAAVLTDINPELVNVYSCVRNAVEAVIEHLAAHQRSHSPDYYYKIRAAPEGNPIERAARFIYLNKTCFNGLYRENSKGQFNVPIGSYKDPKICCPELLRSVSACLQTSTIAERSFDAVLDWAKTPSDFVYFDPPYHPISDTSRFTAYSRYSFYAEDQIRLRDTFITLAQRGVKVMLSNSDCPFIHELYQGFNIYSIEATRAINSNIQKRGKITEILVTSY
jgi:DNA adenine methylase